MSVDDKMLLGPIGPAHYIYRSDYKSIYFGKKLPKIDTKKKNVVFFNRNERQRIVITGNKCYICLPDDVLLNCLARVSRLYYPTLSLVSKRFRSLLGSKTRTLLGLTESCLYVSLVFPRSCKSRWFTLCGIPTRFPNPSSRWFTLSLFA